MRCQKRLLTQSPLQDTEDAPVFKWNPCALFKSTLYMTPSTQANHMGSLVVALVVFFTCESLLAGRQSFFIFTTLVSRLIFLWRSHISFNTRKIFVVFSNGYFECNITPELIKSY
jgi:hypothetical protein